MNTNVILFKLTGENCMKKCLIITLSVLLSFQCFAQSKWFMAQTDTAKVRSVTATSELVEAQFDGKFLYPPINILDGDFNNTWCEADQKGSGIGESITVEFMEPVSFDEIQLVNGFVSKDYYLKNNRVKTIKITQVAKEHFQQKEYTLKDNVQTWQSIKFDLTQTAQTITLEIRDVYKGSKYDDTCLDDMRLLYKGKIIPFENVGIIKAAQEENSKQMLKSNAVDFKKKLFALAKDVPIRLNSYSQKSIFLKADKGNSSKFIAFSDDGKITSIDDCTILTKTEFMKEKNPDSEFSYYWREFFRNKDNDTYKDSKYDDEDDYVDNYDYSKFSYFVCYDYPYYGWRNRIWYELGNSRIITTTTIDYVEVKTVTLVKIDGNSIFIDGVKYNVINPDTILDCRTAPEI